MPTFGPISDNADNGYQEAGFFTPGFLFFGNQGGASMHACGRWQGVGTTVPAGVTILSASWHIRARGSVTGTIGNVHAKMVGHKGDAPVFGDGTFEPGVNFTPTTSDPLFNPAAWVDGDYYDIDFTSVMQEIVNGDWGTGYDLALAVTDTTSVSGNFARMYAQADGDPDANKITITFASADGPQVAIITQVPRRPAVRPQQMAPQQTLSNGLLTSAPPFFTTIDAKRVN